MAIVAPTITAEDAHQYRAQIEIAQKFSSRIHIDLMDGVFTPNKSIEPSQVWLPDDITCDIHIMFQNPLEACKELALLNPSLITVPVEADFSHRELRALLGDKNIKLGVALLAQSAVEDYKEVITEADHVLIFSGNLGYQGGSTADLSQLSKVAEIKAINSSAEIGWDGGVNNENIAEISEAGVFVINVGGYIHHSHTPEARYNILQQQIS